MTPRRASRPAQAAQDTEGQFRLRNYQQSMVDRLRASTELRTVAQCPTGSGKSVIIREISKLPERLVVMAHAEWLIDQLSAIMPCSHQVIKAGVRWDGSKRIVGMIQTIANRIDDIPEPDVVITDEGHHAVSPVYRRVLGRWPNARVVLFTATPQRLDGQGLEAVADDMVCGPQYQELIDAGYLKPFELYGIPSGVDLSGCRVIGGDYRRGDANDAIRKSTIFGDVVDHWRRLGRDGGHVSFWPSIAAAEHAASETPGWHALHSKMPKETVKALIGGLRTGNVLSLCSVDMIGEGLDVPGLSSVSLCRPTKSLTVFMQQAGRCNRGGHGVARVIDHVGNRVIHGFPDDDREWSLKGRIKKKRTDQGVLPVWDCPECWSVNRSIWDVCQGCGAAKPREIRVVEQRDARLELISRAARGEIHDLCETPEEYREFAKLKGKTPGWAAYQWALRDLREAPDNVFMEAAGTPRPTREQFMRAAWTMGIDPKHSAIFARQISLT